MRTLTTNFGGRKIVINQHFPDAGTPAGGDCFELAGAQPGSGDWQLGTVMWDATGDPRMVRVPDDDEPDAEEEYDDEDERRFESYRDR